MGFRRDADARIDHLEAQQAIVADHLDAHDDFTGIRELDGIAHQVDQYLPQAHGVAAHLGRYVESDIAGQFEPLGMGARRADLDGLLHCFPQAKFDAFQLELAGFDFREIQDIVDDLQQRSRGMGDGLREVPLARRQFRCLQQFRHAHDPVHRRADFVAHACEKFALGAAGALGRLFGARGLVDGHPQFAIGVAQVLRALGHLLLEELTIFFQTRITMSDLPEHLVEAVDEGPDFVF